MNITSIKKIRFGYLVTIDQAYQLEEDIVVKYRLIKGKEITKQELVEILKDNEKATYIRKGLLYLKNSHSTHEFKTYLRTLGASEPIVESITHDFKKRHYLDDQSYAKIMVERYKSKYGYIKVNQLLASKGIHKDIIENLNYKEDLDDLSEKLDKAIIHNKKPNYYQAKNQLLRQFIAKGYDLETVSRLLDDKLKVVKFDTFKTIKKDLERVIKKYESLESKDRLKKIKQALYQKGYSQQAIEAVFIEMGRNDV